MEARPILRCGVVILLLLATGCVSKPPEGQDVEEEPFDTPFPTRTSFATRSETFEVDVPPSGPAQACAVVVPAEGSRLVALAGVVEWLPDPPRGGVLQASVQGGTREVLRAWSGETPLAFDLEAVDPTGMSILVRVPDEHRRAAPLETLRLEVRVAYEGARPPTVASSECP